MSKIVINSKLAFKQDSYNTSPCVVEKVIGLPESEFSELKNHTLKDNCYIKQYKDLMGYRDNAYHCLLFVDTKNGDGILVESEGADYARYSQYVPNARAIINHSDIVAKLRKGLDECADELIEESGSNDDVCISVHDLINNPTVSEAIIDMFRESLAKRPEINPETILDTNGFIEAYKNTDMDNSVFPEAITHTM